MKINVTQKAEIVSAKVACIIMNRLNKLTCCFWKYAPVFIALLLLAVLAGLSRLSIQLRFGDEFINIRKISLRTAAPVNVSTAAATAGSAGASRPSAVPVPYVENCTCAADDHVSGTSVYLYYISLVRVCSRTSRICVCHS